MTGPWADRVDAVDGSTIRSDLDAYGCAVTGPLLTAAETADIAALYPDDSRFRSTVDMGRYRFGEGEYRYFAQPYPEAVSALKRALYPLLVPIARDWWTKLNRPTPWPDTLDDWLDMCHAGGQPSPRRSCSSTAKAAGTRYIEISTATSSFRCKS